MPAHWCFADPTHKVGLPFTAQATVQKDVGDKRKDGKKCKKGKGGKTGKKAKKAKKVPLPHRCRKPSPLPPPQLIARNMRMTNCPQVARAPATAGAGAAASGASAAVAAGEPARVASAAVGSGAAASVGKQATMHGSTVCRQDARLCVAFHPRLSRYILSPFPWHPPISAPSNACPATTICHRREALKRAIPSPARAVAATAGAVAARAAPALAVGSGAAGSDGQQGLCNFGRCC